MRSARFIWIIFLFSLLFVSNPLTLRADESRPPYVGVWEGIDIQGVDIIVIVDEKNYEIQLYRTGFSEMMVGSVKGTHGDIVLNDISVLDEDSTWNGTEWISYTAKRFIQISIEGNIMYFKYDWDPIHNLPWDVEGLLIKK